MKGKEMRCISVAENAKKYFAHVASEDAAARRAVKTGYLLGTLEAAVDREESAGEMLVISVAEVTQLMRDAMEVKRKR